MANSTALNRIPLRGRRTGFGNMLRKESAAWWGTRTWLVQAIIWLLIINGIVAVILWTVPQATADLPSDEAMTVDQALPEAVEIFFALGGMAAAVGIIIVMQGSVLDETQSGTLAWVLSKPVARPAILAAKFIANGVSALLIMVLLQGFIAYGQFALAGDAPPFGSFIAGLSLLALHLLFYLSFTLMTGIVLKNRGGALGLGMLLVFGYQVILGIVPVLGQIGPWALIAGISLEVPTGLAHTLAQGQPLPTMTPILATAAWVVIFFVVSVWWFNRQEF
jgi:ABC-type transport system involved in multi-copper enzyme maturation permease subunit